MEGTERLLMIEAPIVVIVAVLATFVALRRNGGGLWNLAGAGPGARLRRIPLVLALVGVWVLVTGVSMWCAFLGGLVGCYLLLFWFGRVGAWLGLIAMVGLLVSLPFVWGWAILTSARRA